jgi:hypothetical protein
MSRQLVTLVLDVGAAAAVAVLVEHVAGVPVRRWLARRRLRRAEANRWWA